MLTKAILTGGVLSVLAGSIVYFGTEGADALENKTVKNVHVEETELAGAAKVAVEAAHPHPEDDKQKQAAKQKLKAKAKARAEARKAKAKAKKAKALAEAEALEEAKSKAVAQTQELEAQAKGHVDGKVVTSIAKSQTASSETETEKSKTRWLDQYLKSNKKKTIVAEAPKAKSEVIDVVVVEKTDEAAANVEENIELEIETGKKMMAEIETEEHPHGKKPIKKKIIIKMDGEENLVWSSADDVELSEDDIDLRLIDGLFSENKDVSEAVKGDVRIMKLSDEKHKVKGHHQGKHQVINYDAVILEAKKLQVIDMRDEAFLEIVDYAVDRRDMGNAADVVEELSSPELRDTARARIGVGLATCGKMEAAFAVLDEIEIDQLVAPIRLEIISALMATRAERAAQNQGAQ